MQGKRRLVHPTAAAAAVALFFCGALPAVAQVEVTIDGNEADFSPAPIVQTGRVFVPLRGVFERLGASVVYSNGTINATGNGRDIALHIGSTQATVNGQAQTIDVAPFIVGASTYVPLRFVSEALGENVDWDDANRIAAITTSGASAPAVETARTDDVDTAPPPIPVYEQPYVPAPNDIWQPGYWAWGSFGYYWVPGTWVQAPQPNYLWTPGYWQWNNGGYGWNPGYWAPSVGFYGGVNYGAGYYGNGYDGGRWSNDAFRYNTFVTRVNSVNVRNVYVDRNVYVNNSPTRISFNGGRTGLQARPTAQQLVIASAHHIGMTAAQRQHVAMAAKDRRLLATVNGNHPPVLAVVRPLRADNQASGFVPVRASDRATAQTHRGPAAHPAPAAAAAAAHGAPAPHGAPAAHAPAIAAPPAHRPGEDGALEAHGASGVPPGHIAPKPHAGAGAAIGGAPPTPVAPTVRGPHAPTVHTAPNTPAVHAPQAPPAPGIEAAPAVRVPTTHAGPPARVPVPPPSVHAAPAAAPPAANSAHKESRPPPDGAPHPQATKERAFR